MSTYTKIIFHVVFATRNRERTLTKQGREVVFRYITGILDNKNCHLFRIGGVEDHIHILFELHPTISLSSLIKDIKVATTAFIKEKKALANFNAWQEGYGGFTHSPREKNVLIEYIKKQEEHHRHKSFKEEYMELLAEHEIEFEEKYLL